MKVLRGFSEENSRNAWVKAEIEVTEDDLVNILAEVELPAEASTSLTAREKFLLLSALAESCLLEQKVMGAVQSSEEVAPKLKVFLQTKTTILDRLKATYVPF